MHIIFAGSIIASILAVWLVMFAVLDVILTISHVLLQILVGATKKSRVGTVEKMA